MLIDLNTLCNKYNFIPKGIIHIGAHLMEEREKYIALGVKNLIWIEANPEIYSKIIPYQSNNELIFNYAISDKDNIEYEFKITNNGESSSILELDLHKHHHPQIHVIKTINVTSLTLDTLIKTYNIDVNNYDFINIDIQGAELLALHGAKNTLNNIQYVYSEVNTNYLYKDCGLVNEIDDYLATFNFSRVETCMTACEWGDALYKKCI